METYRVLVVGCGRIAGGFEQPDTLETYAKTHAGAYLKHPRTKVTSCVDVDIDCAKAFAKKWGIKHAYACLNDIAEQETFDIISICSPSPCHFDDINKCFRFSPKVIFCEKPLTTSLSESKSIYAQCQAHHVQLVVNYSRRWDKQVEQLKTDLQSKAYGELQKVVATYSGDLLNNGSHMLELLLRLVGEMTVECALSLDDSEHVSVDAILGTQQNALVHLMNLKASHYALFEITFYTSKAEITMLESGMKWRYRDVSNNQAYAGYQMLQNERVISGGYLPVLESAVAEIINSLDSGTSLMSHAQSALDVQTLCEQIIKEIKNAP